MNVQPWSAALCLLVSTAGCASTGSASERDGPDARAPSSNGDATSGPTRNDASVPSAPHDAGSGDDASGEDASGVDATLDGDAGPEGGDSGSDAAVPVDASDPTRGMQALTVDQHSVWVYLPQSMKATDRGPVIYSLHGLDVPNLAMADITGLPALAEQEHFIPIFPEGAGGLLGDTWNTGNATCGLGSFAGNSNDDDTYLNDVLDAVEKTQAIDRDHVFMSGFSMGAYGTHNFSCAHRELARAGAAASGGRTTEVCDPKPVPMIIFHGKNDGTISYDCGVQARAAWVAHNGCSTDVDSVAVTGGTCETSRNCPAGGEVVFCSFDTMGHGWAGSTDPFAFGGGSANASATTLMWNFFKKYL